MLVDGKDGNHVTELGTAESSEGWQYRETEEGPSVFVRHPV